MISGFVSDFSYFTIIKEIGWMCVCPKLFSVKFHFNPTHVLGYFGLNIHNL